MSDEFKRTSDIDNIFDDIIMNGYKCKEAEIVPGFKIKLRPLSYNDLFRAEAEISRRNPDIPQDLTVKLKCGKILSYATVEINGSPIEVPNDPEATEMRRISIYDHFVRGPQILVQKAYELYLQVVTEENEFYANPEKAQEKIENF